MLKNAMYFYTGIFFYWLLGKLYKNSNNEGANMDKTFTLRMPASENEQIQIMAQRLCISQNSLIRLATTLFMDSYKDLVNQNQSEILHFLAHKQKQTAPQDTLTDY